MKRSPGRAGYFLCSKLQFGNFDLAGLVGNLNDGVCTRTHANNLTDHVSLCVGGKSVLTRQIGNGSLSKGAQADAMHASRRL